MINRPRIATTLFVPTLPSSNRGTITLSVMRRTTTEENTVHAAKTAAQPTAVKKRRLWWRKQPADQPEGLGRLAGIGGNDRAATFLGPFFDASLPGTHVYWF